MPKKINKKQEKNFGKLDEDKRIKNTKILISIICIIGLLIMISVGMFIFIRDRGYSHSDNPIVFFSYSEGLYTKGYDVYRIEVLNDGIYTLHNLGEESKNIEENWSNTKYLNFNEELYESGALEFNVENNDETSDSIWSYKLEISFKDGENFVSYGNKHPENTEKFRELIKKYFDSDIEL